MAYHAELKLTAAPVLGTKSADGPADEPQLERHEAAGQ
jgi:hypothetical protein